MARYILGSIGIRRPAPGFRGKRGKHRHFSGHCGILKPDDGVFVFPLSAFLPNPPTWIIVKVLLGWSIFQGNWICNFAEFHNAFRVLCQIVCLNLVYFTFLVLDVLSAEIFISLPLRSCAFPLFCEKMCWPALCIWVIVFILITWVAVEGDWVVWPVLFLAISSPAFIHSLLPTKFLTLIHLTLESSSSI